jgi:4-amino-4-deoxy-L-arabinose transferase-like glycosyltransferase
MISIIIFLLTFIARFPNIALFSLNHDEANWTLGALDNFVTFMGIPVACFKGYLQPFYSCLVFFSRILFHSPEMALRMPAVIIGSLTAVLLYQLTKELYGKKAGIVSALLLCFLPWHVIESRVGVSLILTPFFACLVFVSLLKALRKQSNVWFVSSWCFLGVGAFYTYQNSLLLLPIFFISLLLLRKEFPWLKPKILLIGIASFLLIVYPLIYLHFKGAIPEYSGKLYRMFYQDADFHDRAGALVIKLFTNVQGNYERLFRSLFFTGEGIEFGQSLRTPLLISIISLPLILFSLALSFWRRGIADKLVITWFLVGLAGCLAGVRFCNARYFIILLPVLLIFIGKLLAEMLERRKVLRVGGIILSLFFISSSMTQLCAYFYLAPVNKWEEMNNSSGCKEAAYFLSKQAEIQDCNLYVDVSMEPVNVYLDYYLTGKIQMRDQRVREGADSFYVLWAPESHPKWYKGGECTWFYNEFRQAHPDAVPVQTVFYAHGLPAIHIYREKGDVLPLAEIDFHSLMRGVGCYSQKG